MSPDDLSLAVILSNGPRGLQAVFEMDGGAGLFVTVASYQTPHLDEIDHTRIAPDLKCTAPTARISDDSDVPMSVRAIGVWEVRPRPRPSRCTA